MCDSIMSGYKLHQKGVMEMIGIYRSEGKDCSINEFHNREYVNRVEVVVKEKIVCGKVYRYVEPSKKGSWAFGGSILYTSTGIFPEFNEPIKLHDRNMLLEK